MKSRIKKINISSVLKILYLAVLLLSVFYVKSVLSKNSFRAVEKEKDKKPVTSKEVSVVLSAEINGKISVYQKKMRNTNTVEDVLRELRKEQMFTYEVDRYAYGTEIANVNGKEADKGKKWTVTIDGKDVTNDLLTRNLENRDNYILSQTQDNSQ